MTKTCEMSFNLFVQMYVNSFIMFYTISEGKNKSNRNSVEKRAAGQCLMASHVYYSFCKNNIISSCPDARSEQLIAKYNKMIIKLSLLFD